MEPADQFSFCEDGDRPQIKKYATNAKFRPADQVYVCVPGMTTHEGPYTVASVYNGRYRLCDEKGNPVKDNNWLKEDDLEFYDPFA